MARKRKDSCLQKTGIIETEIIAPLLAHLLLLSVIFFAGGLCYANTFSVPFVLDDVTSILTNPLVKDFSFRLKPRILGDLSFALNYKLHGLDLSGYHLVNLFLHLLNAVLVYLLTQLIFRTPLMSSFADQKIHKYFKPSLVFSFIAALIFVTHPLQTQAVTYLAQRVTLLAASFYLGAIICYAGFRLASKRIPAVVLFAGSLFLAVNGVLAKENAVTIPFAILLFELTFFLGDIRRRLLPLCLYLVPLFIAPFFILGRIGFSSDLLGEVARMSAESGAPPRLTYLLTQFPVILSYLRLFFFPLGQNLDHDIHLRSSFLDPVVFVSFFMLAALAAGGFYLWCTGRREKCAPDALKTLAAFGIGWFFITLSVESTVIPIRDVMFEHRLYLPSVGLIFVLISAGWLFFGSITGKDPQRTLSLFSGTMIVLVLMLTTAAFMRNRVWKDEISLWQDVVLKSPLKARAHGSLAHAYQRSGLSGEALKCYLVAVRLAPDDHIARNNLGALYLSMKQPEAAVEQFVAALRKSPSNAQISFNLGYAFEKLGRLDESVTAYRESIRLNKNNDTAFNNLGIILYKQGKVAEALTAFSESVRINPGNKEAVDNLALLEKVRK